MTDYKYCNFDLFAYLMPLPFLSSPAAGRQPTDLRISHSKDGSVQCKGDMAILTSGCDEPKDCTQGIIRTIVQQRKAYGLSARSAKPRGDASPARGGVSKLGAKRRGNLSILATAAAIASTVLASPLVASATSVPGALALLPSSPGAAVNPSSPAQAVGLPNFVLDNTPQRSAIAAAAAAADDADVADAADAADALDPPPASPQTGAGIANLSPTASVVLDNNGRPPMVAATLPATTAQLQIPLSSLLSAGYLGPSPSAVPLAQSEIGAGQQQPAATQISPNGANGANRMPAASGRRFPRPVNGTQVEAARQQAARMARTTTIVAVAFGLSIFLVLVGILVVFFFYWRRNNEKKGRFVAEKGRISPPIPFDGTNKFPSTIPPPQIGVQPVLPSISSFGSPTKAQMDMGTKQNAY